MKNIIITIAFLFVSQMKAQEFVKDTTAYEQFKIELGVFVPMGNLQSKMGVSQQASFWYRYRIEHNDLFDIGFSLVLPNDKQNFEYTGQDSIFSVKPKGVTVMLAMRINKLYEVSIFNKKGTLEWSTTYGGSFLSFEDKENPEDLSGYFTDENGNEYYRFDTNTNALSCLFMSQGLTLTSRKFGISVHYNFTPYHWFSKRIQNDFGKSSMSIVMSYKF